MTAAFPSVEDRRRTATSFERAACTAIVGTVPHAIVLIDARRRIVLINRAAAVLFDRAPTAARSLAVIDLLPADAINVVLSDFGPRGIRVVETSLPSKNRTPSLRTIKITAAPLANRKINQFTLLVVEDITDTAKLEQQLVDSETQAAMGQLAAGLLHEVSNPLTGLGSNLLFVRNALITRDAAELTQALDASLDQLEQMRQLLATLSNFPGRAAPRYELADLHHVLRQCLTFIAKDAERRQIAITATLSGAAVPCEMDVRLIKQVLLNLLKNAMEAIRGDGRIAVSTFMAPPGRAPASVVIEIADNGVGIAEADLRRVFRPLFSTKPRGEGLGLSFCRQAVEEHGGDIRITSAGRDQGTSVHVTLPLRQSIHQDD